MIMRDVNLNAHRPVGRPILQYGSEVWEGIRDGLLRDVTTPFRVQ